MVDRLPAWIFLSLALLLIGIAQLPIIRVLLGIDQEFSLRFITVVMTMIGGLMCGLTAMILLVRRQTPIDWKTRDQDAIRGEPTKRQLTLLNFSGLLLFTGIPLLNFLVAYWLWLRSRNSSELVDAAGISVLNFQITIYLYLLLSLFMVFAGIGILTTPIILLFHLLVTITAGIYTVCDKKPLYPANIPIIQGR